MRGLALLDALPEIGDHAVDERDLVVGGGLEFWFELVERGAHGDRAHDLDLGRADGGRGGQTRQQNGETDRRRDVACKAFPDHGSPLLTRLMSIDACDANGRESIACRARVARLLLDGVEREPGDAVSEGDVTVSPSDRKTPPFVWDLVLTSPCRRSAQDLGRGQEGAGPSRPEDR